MSSSQHIKTQTLIPPGFEFFTIDTQPIESTPVPQEGSFDDKCCLCNRDIKKSDPYIICGAMSYKEGQLTNQYWMHFPCHTNYIEEMKSRKKREIWMIIRNVFIFSLMLGIIKKIFF